MPLMLLILMQIAPLTTARDLTQTSTMECGEITVECLRGLILRPNPHPLKQTRRGREEHSLMEEWIPSVTFQVMSYIQSIIFSFIYLL